MINKTKKNIIFTESQIKKIQSLLSEDVNAPYTIKTPKVKKARQGVMMYENQYDELIDNALSEIENDEVITLYHGLKNDSLEYVLEEGQLTPHRSAEQHSPMIWFSTEKDSVADRYPCKIAIDIKRSQISEYRGKSDFTWMNDTMIISEKPILFNEYNFRVLKICGFNLDELKKDLLPFWRKEWNENNYEMIRAIQENFEECPIAWEMYILPLLEGNDFIEENIETEVEADDISLSSFKPKPELNEKFWVNGLLNSRVRLRLLDIADDFIKTLDVDWVKPKDIILTGSLANFNWSNYSDIDLHIIYDFKEVGERTDFVQEYFKNKKTLWNDEHEQLKIYGYPVELYVQDISEIHNSSAIYSLEENKWIKEPSKENITPIMLDKFTIKEKSALIMTMIDDFQEKVDNTEDEWELSKLSEQINKLWLRIKHLRKAGLTRAGEMSPENITFKILRRTGYLEKLWNLKVKSYDFLKSIS